MAVGEEGEASEEPEEELQEPVCWNLIFLIFLENKK